MIWYVFIFTKYMKLISFETNLLRAHFHVVTQVNANSYIEPSREKKKPNRPSKPIWPVFSSVQGCAATSHLRVREITTRDGPITVAWPFPLLFSSSFLFWYSDRHGLAVPVEVEIFSSCWCLVGIGFGHLFQFEFPPITLTLGWTIQNSSLRRAPATPGSFGSFDSTSQWLAWLGLRIQIFCISRHWLWWLFLKSTGLGSSFVPGIMYFGLFVVVLVAVGVFLL